MSSMRIPEPVVSLAVTPETSDSQNFFKALARFQREDPTFRVHTDHESGEIIMSGMGELHLEVYAERIRREYNIPCRIGNPKVLSMFQLFSRIQISCHPTHCLLTSCISAVCSFLVASCRIARFWRAEVKTEPHSLQACKRPCCCFVFRHHRAYPNSHKFCMKTGSQACKILDLGVFKGSPRWWYGKPLVRSGPTERGTLHCAAHRLCAQ
jgi:hypothetical protein